MKAESRKQKTEIVLTREDADALLRKIGELEKFVSVLEAEAEVKINAIRNRLVNETAPARETIKEYAEALEEFAERDRASWGGKTLELNFGKLFFRTGTGKITFKSAAKVIALCKSLGWKHLIRTMEKPDKEKMEYLSDEKLKEIGARRDKKERFHYETKREEVK